jgi:hypothetical protein
MAAHLIVLTSAESRAGKTTLAAALARWLHRHSRAVLPLHCSTSQGDLLDCPTGGKVSRAAAILAEACGVHPETEFEGGLKRLTGLSRRAEYLVVELAARMEWHGGPEPVVVERGAARMGRSGRTLGFFPTPPAELFPAEDGKLTALPPYRPGVGRRTGVVSLPHLEGFDEFSLLRGMEWMTSPPPGVFGVIIIPRTSSPGFDSDWMGQQGLGTWLEDQKAAGCRVLSVGGWYPGCEPLAPGALSDHRVASEIQGFRLPQPLPAERDLDRLAEWFERHAEMAAWQREFF